MAIIVCTECRKEISDKAAICPHCGNPLGAIRSPHQSYSYNIDTPSQDVVCPKCRSTQISSNKKGFSGTNAVAGALLTGGVGVLAGTIGSNKVKITCLKCGYVFNPGDKPITPTEPMPFKWSTFLTMLAVLIPFLVLFFLILHFWGFLAVIIFIAIYLAVLKFILF
ncbi:MAG: zinc ribbon domain-containing protein [Bacteroidetes bacterium]|nr:zinc ribbon domain-containing protein [Bacteroidota bacterium]